MKVRIKFSKTGCMKFIGHLDIMRYFQKAIKRANIDIKYSEGYNPHQVMSFAAPLGVGLTSEGEYLDIELNSSIPSKQAVAALNETMVEGMEILEFSYLPDTAKNAMSSICAGEYYLYLKDGFISETFSSQQSLEIAFNRFMEQDEIIVTKETKKGEATFDLKPHIYGWDVIQHEEFGITLNLILATGSETNIKPEFVLANFYKFLEIEEVFTNYQIHRVDLYTFMDGEYVSLGDLGENVA